TWAAIHESSRRQRTCADRDLEMSAISWLRKAVPAASGQWPLDRPLLRFGSEPWTLRDSFAGCSIMGQTGSGKTSASGYLIARKMLEAGYGGLVCCAKADEADRWRGYLKETGREKDGRFFGVDSDFRFNFIDEESKVSSLAFVENLVSLLCDVASIKRSTDGGSNQAFWAQEKAKLIRNAITLLLLAGRPIEIKSLYYVIGTSPRTADQLNSTEWCKSSFLYQMFEEAHKRNGDHEEFALVQTYFLVERLEIHGGTRGTIEAEFTGTFDSLRRGKIGELFGTS